jgi:hypothetical protein
MIHYINNFLVSQSKMPRLNANKSPPGLLRAATIYLCKNGGVRDLMDFHIPVGQVEEEDDDIQVVDAAVTVDGDKNGGLRVQTSVVLFW